MSGIWPPDIGGPATHMPQVADFLHAQGHRVEVVTTAPAPPEPRAYPVSWVSRSRPAGVRHLLMAGQIARAARRADVVYATSVPTRAALGASVGRTPLVLKLTTDDAFERALRLGWFRGEIDAFQSADGVRCRALRAARDAALRRAAALVCPSTYLAGLVVGWGVQPERVFVIPNAGPEANGLPARDRDRHEATVLAFAGRLGPQKALDVALDALARVPDVRLLVAGDGPDRAALEGRAAALGLGGRVDFLGAVLHERVLELLRAADGSLLSSDWENCPHGVVESLAVGTPVIATAVGGVPELVRDGSNGLLVPPRDPAALAAAISRFASDPQLRASLAAGAGCADAGQVTTAVLARLEQLLGSACQAEPPVCPGASSGARNG